MLVALIWAIKVSSVVPELFASYVLVLYPTGHLIEGRWGRITAASVVGSTISGAMQFLGPGTLDFIPVIGRDGDNSVLEGEHVLMAPVIGPLARGRHGALRRHRGRSFLFPIQLAAPVIRFRRSSPEERERLYWILWAVVAIALVVAADTIVREGTLDAWTVGVGSSVLAAAMTVGLLDQTRVSGEDLFTKTVVYGGLWVLVLGLDLAFLSGLTFVLGDSLERAGRRPARPALLGGDLRAPARGGVAAGAPAPPRPAGEPLRRGRRAGRRARARRRGADQLLAVARAVGRAFGVSYVAVEVDRVGGARLTATSGIRPREVRSLPISYRGREVGRLVLPARGLRTRLSRRDEELLADLIRQAAVAARTTQLADELQDNRERLVLAREEERRRLRRDLHDGLGPSLGGAVFQLDSARLTVDSDPEAAAEQLRVTETHLLGVMDDVRRLVSDLRPPALDTLGLAGALRQQGDLVAGLDVRVEAPGAGRSPPCRRPSRSRPTASPARRSTNVSRHAGARSCAIRLVLDGEHLLVEVADDGVGIAADREAGVGLLSLRERADELGGRTEVTCPPTGGTVVRAWLPVSVIPSKEVTV